jgi:hypothetical protein
LTREIRNDGETTMTTLLFFCTVSFSFCLVCGKTHRHILSVE